MKHKDIPREHWRVFCEQFSRQHRGWLTTLAVVERQSGPSAAARRALTTRLLAKRAAFSAIAGEVGGVEDELAIEAGTGAQRVRHLIARPTRMRLEQNDDGADAELRIQTADGATTIVSFRKEIAAG